MYFYQLWPKALLATAQEMDSHSSPKTLGCNRESDGRGAADYVLQFSVLNMLKKLTYSDIHVRRADK
jgi:hypothetical protein